jgi:low affinity Fe/Cu permease
MRRKVRRSWEKFARLATQWSGRPAAFGIAVAIVVVWLATGPIFHFSDTWQLVINTTTTVLTFLMVFLIQNTINRDSLAIHAKLDELIRVTQEASNAVMKAEEMPEKSIEHILQREKGGEDVPPPTSGTDR